MLTEKRIAITGMAINTPLADDLDGYLDALLAGRSAITLWKSFDTSRIYSKVAADLRDYDIDAKTQVLAQVAPELITQRLRAVMAKAPWSVKLSMLLAVDAWCASGLAATDLAEDAALIISGHNLNSLYQFTNYRSFEEEPDFVDALYPVHYTDTTHIGCVSDVLQIKGTGVLVGAACASGGYGLRTAVDEIRYHRRPAALVVGAVVDADPVLAHALALVGAISQDTYVDTPSRASRPFDVHRDGFVPAHGGGAIVLEDWDRAIDRGARIYAEVLGVETSMDATYLPQPSEDGQARAICRVLDFCGVAPEQIDYINGHFTSTPVGDIAEIRAIKQVFGAHAYRLKANATKSMLGHTMMASAVVETVGAVLQIQAGRLHPSINIDEIDPAIDLDVCRDGAVDWPVRYCLKNAFGFGGLNASILLKRHDGPGAPS